MGNCTRVDKMMHSSSKKPRRESRTLSLDNINSLLDNADVIAEFTNEDAGEGKAPKREGNDGGSKLLLAADATPKKRDKSARVLEIVRDSFNQTKTLLAKADQPLTEREAQVAVDIITKLKKHLARFKPDTEENEWLFAADKKDREEAGSAKLLARTGDKMKEKEDRALPDPRSEA